MSITLVKISRMTPSFSKSLFRLVGAEYHSNPPLYYTWNIDVVI